MKRMLIVDDQPAIRALLEEVLKDEFEIICISSGEEAVEVSKKFMPDIVLLDIGLSGMSGIEILPIILREVPESTVIMLTGSTSSSKIKEALSLGARGCITKPFDIFKVKTSIETIVSGSTAV